MSQADKGKADKGSTPWSGQDSGKFLKQRRLELGLTMAQVKERSTVPNVAYLGSLEAGRNNVARSKHLPSLARALELSEGDLARITGRPMFSASVDVRHSSRLNRPTVLAGKWNGAQAGAYTLDEAPETILVVDPAQKALVVGQHYVILVSASGEVVRSVSVEAEGKVQVLQGSRVLASDEVIVVGRIVHEGRAL